MEYLEKAGLGYYERRIITEFAISQIDINFKKIGDKNFDKTFPVDLDNIKLLDEHQLRNEIVEVIDFLNVKAKRDGEFIEFSRPVWLRTNVMDNAMNFHVGIGFLNIESQWLNFVICSLSIDRAEQVGDTLFTIFGRDFSWAVNFILDQEASSLIVQRFQR